MSPLKFYKLHIFKKVFTEYYDVSCYTNNFSYTICDFNTSKVKRPLSKIGTDSESETFQFSASFNCFRFTYIRYENTQTSESKESLKYLKD